MTFQPTNFRTLPDDFPCEIRTAQHLSLILVDQNGVASYARTVGDKEILTKKYIEGDLLLLAWTGSYRTDIFLITSNDLKKYYRR